MSAEVEGWYRELREDRVEIYLKTDETTMRYNGPRDGAQKFIETFEDITGKRVSDPKKKNPLFDQIAKIEGQTELEV